MTESAVVTPLPTSHLPPTQTLAERVRARADARGMTQRDLADELGVTESVISEWLRGRYTHASRIEASAKAWLARLAVAEPIKYVELKASALAMEACEFALARQSIALIVGRPGVGKTVGVNEFRRRCALRNQEIIHHECAPTIRQHSLLKMLCTRFELRTSGTSDDLLQAIVRFMTRKPVPMVFDEANHMRVPVLEAVRYIHDRVGAPVVLCGSIQLLRTLTQAGDQHLELEQLHSRIGIKTHLQPMTSKETVRFVQAHFPSASGEVCEEFRRHSRGVVRDVLNAIRNAEDILEINKSAELTVKVVEAAFKRAVLGAN